MGLGCIRITINNPKLSMNKFQQQNKFLAEKYTIEKETQRIGVESRNGFDADFICAKKFNGVEKTKTWEIFQRSDWCQQTEVCKN